MSSNIINKHPKVILSPSVIFSILDYHIRRGTDRDRAFGIFLMNTNSIFRHITWLL